MSWTSCDQDSGLEEGKSAFSVGFPGTSNTLPVQQTGGPSSRTSPRSYSLNVRGEDGPEARWGAGTPPGKCQTYAGS